MLQCVIELLETPKQFHHTFDVSLSCLKLSILEFSKWLPTLQGAFHPSMVVPCCCCSMSILATCSIITWKLSSVSSAFTGYLFSEVGFGSQQVNQITFNCTAGAMPFHCRHTLACCFWTASLCLPGRPQWWIHCLLWFIVWLFVCLLHWFFFTCHLDC